MSVLPSTSALRVVIGLKPNQEAFASLAAASVKGCYQLAFRILRDPHRAEDTTQAALAGRGC